MTYKIVYLEDLQPDSIEREINRQGFEVIHINPEGSFEDTLSQIQSVGADLLLMDFRLNAGVAKFNAPPFAQFFRSEVINHNQSLPIVVISSENNIRDYYRDYTSIDLFDFAVDKETFLRKTTKYCLLFKELIENYRLLHQKQSTSGIIGTELLCIPENIKRRIDRRLIDMLSIEKYQSDPFMMSGFLLSAVVKPIGLLIGPDVLAARLGISSKSKDWSILLNHLAEYKYSGLYSKTYERWWSQGIEVWWDLNFSKEPILRRLTSSERCKLISEKYQLQNLTPIDKLEFSNSSRFWTICMGYHKPLDPIDGFEIIKDLNSSPWLEPKFYSLDFLVNHAKPEIIKQLKDQERMRFLERVRA